MTSSLREQYSLRCSITIVNGRFGGVSLKELSYFLDWLLLDYLEGAYTICLQHSACR